MKASNIFAYAELSKFSADDEQHCPQSDLDEMRYKHKRYRQRGDCEIDNGACTCVPSFSLIANEIHRRGHSERMDENRTCDCA